MKRNLIDSVECKQIAFQGLMRFRQICEENDLTYFLAYGTLLGAVRHKGFIPWDDDIDVTMPRNDYERLLEISDAIENEEWKLLSYLKTTGYCRPWMKLANKNTILYPTRFNSGFTYGVSIDIFPLDYIEGNCYQDVIKNILGYMQNFDKKMNLLRPISVVKSGPFNGFKRIIKKKYYQWIGKRRISFPEIVKELESVVAEKPTKYVAMLFDKDMPIWRTEDFWGQDMMVVRGEFENMSFRIPANYHAILTEKYGDYMLLPPMNKRITNHHYKAYKI